MDIPMGTVAGARAMRQACEALGTTDNFLEWMKSKPELRKAIEKWGYLD